MEKICIVNGCKNKTRTKKCDYCGKHYMQIRRHGTIQEITRYDANEIIEYDDFAEVVLRDIHNNITGKIKIDLECIELVKSIKWYLHSDGYARNRKIGSMHRYIMNCPVNMVVDHINHNTLDNRRENLRICTQQQNQMNMSLNNKNTSGYSGVDKLPSGKWRSRIHINNKEKHLGVFDTYEDAIAARQQAEIDYFGDFAPHLNDKE